MPDDLTTLIGGLGGSIILITCLSTAAILALTVVLIIVIRRAVGPNRAILKEGVSGEATILSVRQTGLQVNDQPQVGFDLEVRLPGREPYKTQIKAVIPIIHIPQFQPGAIMPVKVDPSDPNKVVFDVYG